LRPVQQSAFIDIPLPLPDAQGKEGFGVVGAGGPLPHLGWSSSSGSRRGPGGSSSSRLLGGGGGGGSRPEACHLMDCLNRFATPEVVEGVDCAWCPVKMKLEEKEEEIGDLERQLSLINEVSGGGGNSRRRI